MELLTPSVATDFIIKAKFLKLPIKAIPDVPRKTEIILEEKIPKKKLTATEKEFSDKTFSSVFCFKIFNLEISYHLRRIPCSNYIFRYAFRNNRTVSYNGISTNRYSF